MKRFALFLPLLFFLAPASAATPSVTLPLCDASRHARYVAIGPDGVSYPTWHPQIDTRYGAPCYFDHEHGSAPTSFLPSTPEAPFSAPAMPLYGYADAKHGMSEAEPGFKTFVFTLGGVRWMVTQHFGTMNASGAACNRMHEFSVAAADPKTFELLADVHMVGDYGRSRSNTAIPTDYAPAACPNQAAQALADGSNGRRAIPTAGNGTNGYEPWTLDDQIPNVLGFRSGQISINTAHPQTIGATAAFTGNVALADPASWSGQALGAWRFVTLYPPFGFTGVVSGTFYTDPMARQPRAATDADAVRQYIKPGWSFALDHVSKCMPFMDNNFWCDKPSGNSETFWRKNPFVTGAN